MNTENKSEFVPYDRIPSGRDFSNVQIAQYPLRYIISSYRDGTYIVPPWQRREAWKDFQRSSLINSIFKGRHIPAIMVLKDINGKENLNDGLQRVQTWSKYTNNEFPWIVEEDDKILHIYFSKVPENIHRKSTIIYTHLSQRVQNIFLNKIVSITRSETLFEEDLLIEQFNVIQYGLSLDISEKLKMRRDNPIIKYINTLIEDKRYLRFHKKYIKRCDYVKILFLVLQLVLYTKDKTSIQDKSTLQQLMRQTFT